jgi:hypothetical protein
LGGRVDLVVVAGAFAMSGCTRFTANVAMPAQAVRFRGDDRLLLTADNPFALTEAEH